MSKAKPTTFLFFGNDTFQSAGAVSAWESLFVDKYGDTTRHVITPDQNDPAAFLESVAAALSLQPLFGEQVLVIIRRPTLFEKGKSQAFSKGLVELLKAQQEQKSLATAVVWVDRDLPPTHPLRSWFAKAGAEQGVKLYHHQAPSNRVMIEQAMAQYETAGYELDGKAAIYLDSLLQAVSKNQRVQERLRATEQPSVDERRWWLRNCLENATLAAEGMTITEDVLARVADSIGASHSPFEFTNALERADFAAARRIAQSWEKQGSERDFFALYSVLGRFYKPSTPMERQYLPELLAEVELISKNTQLPLAAVTDVFLARLRDAKAGRQPKPIIEPKKLWHALL